MALYNKYLHADIMQGRLHQIQGPGHRKWKKIRKRAKTMLSVLNVPRMAQIQMPMLLKPTSNQSQTQNPVTAFACRIFPVIKCKIHASNAEGEKKCKN
jgi:hypothetical protein